jgi:5-formyltetrahydrofolate cyclo-ligase
MSRNAKSSESALRSERHVDPVRAQWRRELRAARSALTDRSPRQARLSSRIEQWLATVDIQRLGFFWPTRGEPDLAALIGAGSRRTRRAMRRCR